MSSEYVSRAPHLALRGAVLGYTGYAESSVVALQRVQPAATVIPLVLSLGPRIAVDGDPRESFVAGLYDGPALTEFTGEQLGVEVDLTPLGARRLLGLPMDELTRQAVPARDVHPAVTVAWARLRETGGSISVLRSGRGLADAAYVGGYADQPHLNREFRALAGRTPTAFDRLPNVQDVRLEPA